MLVIGQEIYYPNMYM